MERILSSFKALYKGEGVCKTHLLAALLFFLPCLAASTFQLIDKDMKELIVPLLIAGAVLLILSIIPMFALSGFYLKFLNKRLSEPAGLPVIDANCIIKGLKFFPIPFVWTIYIGLPILIYFAAIFTAFAFYISSKPDTLGVILATIAMFGLVFLFFIPLFIISPFISFINMKYCENFEYSAELFNPLTPFRYMKKAFKDAIIVALKFIVVSMVTSIAVQIVIFLGMIILMIFGLIAAILIPDNVEMYKFVDIYKMPVFVISVILLSGLLGVVSAYVKWITGLAYGDNLLDVYKEKIMDNQGFEVEEAGNNE